MSSIFTDHVRHLDPKRYPDEAFWSALRRAVFAKLRDRRLADALPAYLGYPTVKSWKDEEAVFDLLLDTYQYAFLDRLRSLRDQLEIQRRANIDGLIHRNIANFLTDRQRLHDPFGYAAFKNIEGAIGIGIASGVLTLAAPKPGPVHIRNGTVVVIAGAPARAQAVTDSRLGAILQEIEAWQAALPRMFRTSIKVQRALQECWPPLARAGVASFACGDLAALAKPMARAHGTAWHAAGGDDRTWEDDDGSGRLVRLVHPPNDDGGSWTNLLDLITAEIGQIKQARLRDRVDELFRSLVASAVLRFDEPMPSQADLSRRLGMPTSTIAESYDRLRKIVEKCRPGASSS